MKINVEMMMMEMMIGRNNMQIILRHFRDTV